jgi:hypothetical protein
MMHSFAHLTTETTFTQDQKGTDLPPGVGDDEVEQPNCMLLSPKCIMSHSDDMSAERDSPRPSS